MPSGIIDKTYAITISYPIYARLYIRRHAFCHTVLIMEIRIDITSEGSETVVRIAGRLSGVAVAQLRKACDPIEGAFVLDLSNLLFADDAGIDAIGILGEKGAEVRGVSPFVQLLLGDALGEETDGED